MQGLQQSHLRQVQRTELSEAKVTVSENLRFELDGRYSATCSIESNLSIMRLLFALFRSISVQSRIAETSLDRHSLEFDFFLETKQSLEF